MCSHQLSDVLSPRVDLQPALSLCLFIQGPRRPRRIFIFFDHYKQHRPRPVIAYRPSFSQTNPRRGASRKTSRKNRVAVSTIAAPEATFR